MKTVKKIMFLSMIFCTWSVLLSGNCRPNSTTTVPDPVIPKPAAKHYRIMQVDKDGNVKYSNVIIVKQ
jgi:hypothetical protein